MGYIYETQQEITLMIWCFYLVCFMQYIAVGRKQTLELVILLIGYTALEVTTGINCNVAIGAYALNASGKIHLTANR